MKGQAVETEVYEDTSLSLEIQHSIGRGKPNDYIFDDIELVLYPLQAASFTQGER